MKKNIIDDDFLCTLEGLNLYMKKNLDGLFGGGRKSDKYGNTVEFADYREYVEGDELRKVDWNVYSRFEKMYIKLFHDEKQVNNHIYIDCSTSMKYGKPSKAHMAVKYAAALGYLSVLGLDRVSYKLLKEDKCEDLGTTIYNKETFYVAMKQLEDIKFKGSVDINSAIRGNADIQRGKGLSIIITDMLTESDWKSAIDYLVYNKRQVLLLHLMSPEELNPYYSGKIKFMDSEIPDEADYRNIKMNIGKKEIKAYVEALEAYVKEINSFCASRNADYILVNCGEPVEDVLLTKGYERGLFK